MSRSHRPRPWIPLHGIVPGVLGMLGFSGTLVATRVAVSDFSPSAVTGGRIVVAAILAISVLWFLRQLQWPSRRLLPSLVWMGGGLAVGFPLFLALALEEVSAVHGAVVTGLAPAATAVIAAVRTGERMSIGFWIACSAGFLGVLYYALEADGGGLDLADIWLFLAVLSLGVAYVEGGMASKALGATVALCWAMLILAPGAAIVLVISVHDLDVAAVSIGSWAGFLYLGVISMFLASVCWYRGLAVGGIARIGQLNLLLPLFALLWAWLILGEEITGPALLCSAIVLVATVVCLRSRAQTR